MIQVTDVEKELELFFTSIDYLEDKILVLLIQFESEHSISIDTFLWYPL